jgi:hypothetical protein
MVLRSVALAGKYCLLSRTGTRADAPVAESKAAALLSIIVLPIIFLVVRERRRIRTQTEDFNVLIYTLLLQTSQAANRIPLMPNSDLVRMIDTR